MKKEIKEASDIILSAGLIILLAPIMALVAIAIKLDSPGPVFYWRQKNGVPTFRIGRNAKLFLYFKFRSMHPGSLQVTRVGRFIRRWHLDELPELFLVFIGDMSLVGPRPRSRNSIPRLRRDYYNSLLVKPGITGPFQIIRNRDDCNKIETVITINHWYAENFSFITDYLIILKTPLAIIRDRKSARGTVFVL